MQSRDSTIKQGLRIISSNTTDDPQTARLLKQLFKDKNVKRLNPPPNLVKKNTKPELENDNTMGKNRKAVPTTSKQIEICEENPSTVNSPNTQEELLKMIENLNKTIERLSQQLEEERQKNAFTPETAYLANNKFAALTVEDPATPLLKEGTYKGKKEVSAAGRKRQIPYSEVHHEAKMEETATPTTTTFFQPGNLDTLPGHKEGPQKPNASKPLPINITSHSTKETISIIKNASIKAI